MTDPLHDSPSADGPPFFRSWRRLYAFVLGFLALLIILFSLLSRAFA